MFNQLHVKKTPFKIQHDQHVDRCAGKTGQWRQGLRFKDIACIGPAGVQQTVDAVLVQRRPQRERRADMGFDIFARQRFGQSRQATEKQHQNACEYAHVRKTSFPPFAGTFDESPKFLPRPCDSLLSKVATARKLTLAGDAALAGPVSKLSPQQPEVAEVRGMRAVDRRQTWFSVQYGIDPGVILGFFISKATV